MAKIYKMFFKYEDEITAKGKKVTVIKRVYPFWDGKSIRLSTSKTHAKIVNKRYL